MKATLITVCDVSGSMGITKKLRGQTYVNYVIAALKEKYGQVVEKYISHTTFAKEVKNQGELFGFTGSGGTFISSGVEKALEIVNKVDFSDNDIYVIFLSDGDNWGEDDDKAVEAMKLLGEKVDYIQFLEIKISTYTSTITDKIKEIKNDRIETVLIREREEAFSKFVKTRETIMSLKSKNQMIKDYDKNARFSNRNISSILREGAVTRVTLKDGTVGQSICNPSDEYNHELGFKIALLRAEILSNQAQAASKKTELYMLVNGTKKVVVVDRYCAYDSYSELASKYEDGTLHFERCHLPEKDEILDLIEYTNHPYSKRVTLAICKDSKNRIIIMGEKGIEELNA